MERVWGASSTGSHPHPLLFKYGDHFYHLHLSIPREGATWVFKISFPLLRPKITGSLQDLWVVGPVTCFPQVLIVMERSKYFHSCRSGCWTFLLSVRIMSQWKYTSGTDRQRDKVTGSIVYQSQRATENDFCSWNKTKTRVEGQLPLLFWLISTPKRPFPNVSGLLAFATL